MSSGTGLRGHSVEGHCLQPATTIGMEELVDGAQDDLSHHRRVHRLDRGRTSGTDGHLVALLDILQLAGSRDDLDAREGDLDDKLPELRQVYEPEVLGEFDRIDRATQHQAEVSGHRRRVTTIQDTGEHVQPIVVRLRLRITRRSPVDMDPLRTDQRTLAGDLSIAMHSQGTLETVPRVSQPELSVLLVVEQPLATRRPIGREVSPERRHEGDPSHSWLELTALR